MNETLKAAGHIGAELGAANAENARLRKALQAIDRRNDSPARFDSEIDAIVCAALSQQAEPECSRCDGFGKELTVYQGAIPCRDCKASPAPAQDELSALKALSVENILLEVVPGDGSGHEVYAKSVADVSAALTRYSDRIEELESELAARPAQTEQHDSDCSTNNRGVPDLLGPCDCSLSEASQ